MAKTNKKKEEVLIENDFYKIISNGKKVIINYNKENLAKANYKSLSKEFERLSKLSMNIIERQTFDGNIQLKDYLNITLYLNIMDELNYFIDRCLDGLYLLYSPKMNLLKIGITNNLEKRIKNINRDINDKVEVLAFHYEKSSLEKFLHNKFKDDNIRFIGTTGTEHREWFQNKNYIKTYFKTI